MRRFRSHGATVALDRNRFFIVESLAPRQKSNFLHKTAYSTASTFHSATAGRQFSTWARQTFIVHHDHSPAAAHCIDPGSLQLVVRRHLQVTFSYLPAIASTSTSHSGSTSSAINTAVDAGRCGPRCLILAALTASPSCPATMKVVSLMMFDASMP